MTKLKYLSVISLFFLLTSQKCAAQTPQEYNLDFEEWVDSTLVDNTSYFSNSVGHDIENAVKGVPVNWTVLNPHRTTDAFSGEFAMVVNRWYYGSKGFASLGSCQEPAYQPCLVEASAKITKITGLYKFYTENNLNAKAVFLGFNFNQTINELDTIAHAEFLFHQIEDYTLFEIPVNYFDSLEELTHFQFYFMSPTATAGVCNQGLYYCNFLYLDDIKFDFTTLSYNTSINNNKGIGFFPNPFSEKLTIQNNEHRSNPVRVFNSIGQFIESFSLSGHESRQVSFLEYPTGVYFLITKNSVFKIIKRPR